MTISEHSIIHENAKIGNNVSIGPFTIIHENVILSDNVVIESHCELGVENALCDGNPLIIGKNSHIRSHSVMYTDSTIGENFITGHRVTIREKSRIGNHVQIGTLSDIQGHCIIGNYTKMHSNVHIGQKTEIADHVWIFPYVVLTNDPHPPSDCLIGCKVNEFAVICTMAVILPGVEIGRDALVGAMSSVIKNVPNETIVVGTPAKEMGHVSKIMRKDKPTESAYPWRRHFHRGYDIKNVEKWVAEFSNG